MLDSSISNFGLGLPGYIEEEAFQAERLAVAVT